MARRRNLLHLSKVDEFAAWAVGLGYSREPHREEAYEVLRLRRPGTGVLVYFTKTGCDHATAFGPGLDLVKDWMRER